MLFLKRVEMADAVPPSFLRIPVFRRMIRPAHKRLRVTYIESTGFIGCTRYFGVYVFNIFNKKYTNVQKRQKWGPPGPESEKNNRKGMN